MHKAKRPVSLADERLRRAFDAGRRAHRSVDLSFERFATYARRVVPKIENGDYYLAVACDHGAPGAWERLQERFRRPLRAMMRRRGASGSDVEVLLDEVWGRLASPPARGGARTRLGTYEGQGPLLAWLATVAWRRLTDAWRERAGSEPLPDAGDPALVAPSDPAAHVAESETDELIGRILEAAWAALTTRELEAVVLKYRHRLPQTEIARALGVTPARVTRLLQSATRRLRSAVEGRFELRAHAAADSNQGALLQILQRMLSQTDVETRGAGRGTA